MRRRGLNKLTSLLLLFLVGARSGSAVAFCQGEEQDARITAGRIAREWPLRSRSDPISRYVWELGQLLGGLTAKGRSMTWYFTVVRNRSPNAFAIGGGNFYVTDGAVAFIRNESQMAAVLAHEMGHQLAGHFCEPAPPGFLDRIFDLFGRAHQQPSAVRQRNVGSLTLVVDLAKEQQADEIAVNLLRMGGYDPVAILELARRLPSGGDSSHLQDPRRIAALEKLLSGVSSRSIGDSTAFQQAKKTLAPE